MNTMLQFCYSLAQCFSPGDKVRVTVENRRMFRFHQPGTVVETWKDGCVVMIDQYDCDWYILRDPWIPHVYLVYDWEQYGKQHE